MMKLGLPRHAALSRKRGATQRGLFPLADLTPYAVGRGALFGAFLLASCGGGTGDIQGTVSGLTASGLTLSDGTESITVAANSTSFSFPTLLADAASYSVTVSTQPAGLVCSVANGSGVVSGTSIISVTVTCSPAYSISGTLSGLTGSGLVIGDGLETINIASGAASFAFPTRIQTGATYAVSVATNPTGQTCSVSNGSGTVGTVAVSNIAIVCQ